VRSRIWRVHRESPLAEASDAPGSGRARDAGRVQRILLEHLDAVWRMARRLGVPDADLDDVAQEVALVVMRREAGIHPGKERAFVMGTAARIASNWRRSRRRQPQPLPDAALGFAGGGLDPLRALEAVRDTQEAALERARGLALLEAAMAEMTREQRVVFTLFELEELSAREIGEQLELAEAAVVSRVRRAREAFQRFCQRQRLAETASEENGRG
jgi:RNA polymerase sigma-70 factor, ECF subfamily